MGLSDGGSKLSPLEKLGMRIVEVLEHEHSGHGGIRDIMSEEDRDALMLRMYIGNMDEVDQFRQQRYPDVPDTPENTAMMLNVTEEWIVEKYAEQGFSSTIGKMGSNANCREQQRSGDNG